VASLDAAVELPGAASFLAARPARRQGRVDDNLATVKRVLELAGC
jgi:hypothetical protein